MGIMFGGDPESFMEAPRMENKSLTGSLGMNPIAAFLDLIGVHKQVAKEPKAPSGEKAPDPSVPPVATTPAILNDVQNALAPQPGQGEITPIVKDQPLTPWGKRWLESNRPLQSIDPDSIFR